MMLFSKTAFFFLAMGAANAANPVLTEPTLKNHAIKEMEHLELSVELMSKFRSWVEYHDKTYDSHDEKMKRLKIWVQNDGKRLLLDGFWRLIVEV